MKSNKIVYRIAVLLSAFFVLNCGGLSTTNGGGHGGGNPPKAKTCAEEGKLSIDNTGTCFKAEAIPANFGELVDLIDKKLKVDPNADLNKIDVSKVTKMTCLFAGSYCKDKTGTRPTELGTKDFHRFNGKIDKWNTSSVISMYRVFDGATKFNGDLSHWNVSKVTNMEYMFGGAIKFNSDISGWDVSNVTDMNSMFESADLFNQNLDSWDVRKVTKIAAMFHFATAFSYPLPSWGKKLPTGVVMGLFVFRGSAVAAGNKYSTWCTTQTHCR